MPTKRTRSRSKRAPNLEDMTLSEKVYKSSKPIEMFKALVEIFSKHASRKDRDKVKGMVADALYLEVLERKANNVKLFTQIAEVQQSSDYWKGRYQALLKRTQKPARPPKSAPVRKS